MFCDELQCHLQFFLWCHNLESFSVSQFFHRKILLQQIQCYCMKRPEKQHLFPVGNKLLFSETFLYLACRLVREREYKHILKCNLFLCMQETDLLDQYRSLSTSHISINQAGIAFILHRFLLILI